MRPYVSGPIAGGAQTVSKEEKLARFDRAMQVLRDAGHHPISPLDVDACPKADCQDEEGHTWACWLKYDLIVMLRDADCIAMLPDWHLSPGARFELQIAKRLGWPVYNIDLEKGLVEHVAQPQYVITELDLALEGPPDEGEPHPEQCPVGPFATREAADAHAYGLISARQGNGSWSIAPLVEP